MYLGTQIFMSIAATDNISQFAHIVGGFCGSLFGFVFPPAGAKSLGRQRRG
jgi:membrane associated rhomboid family serine protease